MSVEKKPSGVQYIASVRAQSNQRVAALFRDRVYTEATWRTYLGWSRYVPRPLVLLRVVFALGPPLLWFTLVAVFVGVYQENRKHGMPNLDTTQLTFTYSLCTFALSLLLVFKTNSSYARWYEARVAWSMVVERSRDLARKAMAYSPEAELNHRKLVVRWIITLPYLLRSHLMAYAPGSLALGELLTAEEHEWLEAQPHKPLAAAQVVSSALAQLKIFPMLMLDLDGAVGRYVDSVITCERLSTSPIPVPYSRITVMFLLVFLTFLPFALWPLLHWYTVLTTFLVAFLLLGVEEIGVQLENPFFVLPMTKFCRDAHADVLALTSSWICGVGKDTYTFVGASMGGEPAWQADSKALNDQMATITAGLNMLCQGPCADPSIGGPLSGLFGSRSLSMTAPSPQS